MARLALYGWALIRSRIIRLVDRAAMGAHVGVSLRLILRGGLSELLRVISRRGWRGLGLVLTLIGVR